MVSQAVGKDGIRIYVHTECSLSMFVSLEIVEMSNKFRTFRFQEVAENCVLAHKASSQRVEESVLYSDYLTTY